MNLQEGIQELSGNDFPIECEKVVQQCEEITVEPQNGSEHSLSDVFDLCEEHPDDFESYDDLRQYVYSMAPKEFVGRRFYDDRGSQQSEETQSF